MAVILIGLGVAVVTSGVLLLAGGLARWRDRPGGVGEPHSREDLPALPTDEELSAWLYEIGE